MTVLVEMALHGGGSLGTFMEEKNAKTLISEFAQFKKGDLPDWKHAQVLSGGDFAVCTVQVLGISYEKLPPVQFLSEEA